MKKAKPDAGDDDDIALEAAWTWLEMEPPKPTSARPSNCPATALQAPRGCSALHLQGDWICPAPQKSSSDVDLTPHHTMSASLAPECNDVKESVSFAVEVDLPLMPTENTTRAS